MACKTILLLMASILSYVHCCAQQQYQLRYKTKNCVMHYSFFARNDSTFVYGLLNEKKTNDPVHGVNIVVQGFRIGTVTDLQGEFRLFLPRAEGVLAFDKTNSIRFFFPYKVQRAQLGAPPKDTTAPFSHQE